MKTRLIRFGFLPRLIVLPLFWVVLAMVVMMALSPHPPRFPLDRYGDKVEHMSAFFALAVLAAAAWPRAPLWQLLVALSLVGALIEVIQAIPALHRTCDVRDWVADMVALVLALGTMALWQNVRGTARMDT
ncbi:hypothetical protein [Novosphingobium sp. FKTRR1]|uniref:hypothetical protein n=1 Tax=Novosphingobium sp. FKTRR1 TaxID=2879118 RepID=UPI001CF08E9A|nr:hypothetical protein [Novosphingobium sp. FKTRR1]